MCLDCRITDGLKFKIKKKKIYFQDNEWGGYVSTYLYISLISPSLEF